MIMIHCNFRSVEDDPAFKEAAAERAANNFDDLQARYAEIDVERKMIDPHRSIWSLAQEELVTQRLRLGEGHAEEAVFHAARAFEGYLRGVYLAPVIEQMLTPFESRLKHVVLEILDFTGPTLNGRTAQRLPSVLTYRYC